MKKLLLLIIILSASFTSCRKDDIGFSPNRAPKSTVLVYMIADNSLNNYAYDNITAMVEGTKKFASKDINVNYVVYLDPKYSDDVTNGVGGNLPRLINISVDSKGNVRRDIVKWFPEQNSASPEVMNSVIKLFKQLYPSDVYGLSLWSHGSAWLPANYTSGKVAKSKMAPSGIIYPETKAFGQDGNNWMEVEDLVAAIPDNSFNYIIFDACYMASVEVLYPLRKKADYIIASSAEILANGFPYDKIIPYIFGKELDLVGLTNAFFINYSGPEALYKYATISMIKTSELEALAQINREIISTNSGALASVNLANVQKFNRLDFSGYYFLDMNDLLSKISTPEQLQRLQAQMDKTVVYENATDYMLNLKITKHSGLTMYFPQTSDPVLEQFYSKLEWYKSVWRN